MDGIPDRWIYLLTLGCPVCRHTNEFPLFADIEAFFCEVCQEPIQLDQKNFWVTLRA